MNSTERKEARYRRRKNKRVRNLELFRQQFATFEVVFTFEHIWVAGLRCCRGVRWKASIQKYELHILTNTVRQQEAVLTHTWLPKLARHFNLFDAGKWRIIDSVTIKTRVIQCTLCMFCLLPLAERIAIPDSYASRKGKGTDYAISRFKQYYIAAVKNNAALVSFDFKTFFASIEHKPLYHILARYIVDTDILSLCTKIMSLFGVRGLQLGSHFSQCAAVIIGSTIDYELKKLATYGYGRYSDDGFLFIKQEEAISTLDKLAAIIRPLGLQLNEKKTRIQENIENVAFIQKRYHAIKDGCTVKISRQSIRRARKRTKKLFKLYDKGITTIEEVLTSCNTWTCFAYRFNNKAAVQNQLNMCKQLLTERGFTYEVKQHKLLRLQ